MASDVRLTTEVWDFSYGVDSSKVPLIQSEKNKDGLPRNALAWLVNGTTRGGGINQRFGNTPLCKVHDGTALYQGGILYDAWKFGGNPYLLLSIGGRMYQVRVDTDNSVVDVTGAFPDSPTVEKCYWCQGEQFAVKQVGDGVTLPVYWDGMGLRRSTGLTGSPPELPAAQSMIYYMGRIWYAQNRKYTAGDIVGGPSGSSTFNFDDAILRVTENPLALAGDGFSVPGQAGNIRALNYPIALDTALGQGPLFVFTPKAIYALTVPVSRADWIAANSNNQPLQRVVMRTNGTVSDRSVVPINGDLFFQSLDPAIRSYFMALRYFGTSWANPPISNNINRAMDFQDRGLMHMCSGMEFGGRLYQTILPFQTPVGVAFSALAVLDTDPITTLQDQKPPVWDGLHTGLDILQVFSGDFGGLERAFAVTHSRIDGGIYVWELSGAFKFDGTATDDRRVEWFFETPAFDWSEYPREAGGGAMELKEIDGLDLWLDRVFGDVLVKVEFRPDEDQCWYFWAEEKICAARTCAEDVNTPICYPYPTEPRSEGYRMPISFPKPTNPQCSVGNPRPVTWGGKFQLKITIKGWCRVRGYQFHALFKQHGPYSNQICTNDFSATAPRQIVAAAGSSSTTVTSAGLSFTYLLDTSDSDPGSGNLKFDLVTLSSIDSLRISKTDGSANNVGPILSIMATNQSQVVMVHDSFPSVNLTFKLTGAAVDHGTWLSIPVTYVSTNGIFGPNAPVTLQF